MNVLEKILQHKRHEVDLAQAKIPLDELKELAHASQQHPQFLAALQQKIMNKEPAVIAEVKKASPSKGVICEDFNPVEIATGYELSGAACVSVLTDEKFFQGCIEYLTQVKAAINLPILRKDFIIDPYQVYETKNIGADCLLLIVAALSDDELRTLYALAQDLDLDVLVEVHNKAELERALKCNAKLIGINNRNLKTFETSIETTLDLLVDIPGDVLLVSESGIASSADVTRLLDAGVYGFLIGESLVKAHPQTDALKKSLKLT